MKQVLKQVLKQTGGTCRSGCYAPSVAWHRANAYHVHDPFTFSLLLWIFLFLPLVALAEKSRGRAGARVTVGLEPAA